jgi:hypothetical protein
MDYISNREYYSRECGFVNPFEKNKKKIWKALEISLFQGYANTKDAKGEVL